LFKDGTQRFAVGDLCSEQKSFLYLTLKEKQWLTSCAESRAYLCYGTEYNTEMVYIIGIC